MTSFYSKILTGFLIGFLFLNPVAFAVTSNANISLTVTDSTPPPPEPEVETSGGNGPPVVQNPNTTEPANSLAFAPLQVIGVQVIPGLTSARVSWGTNRPAKAKITWGKTLLDESNLFYLTDFVSSHTFDIPNLISGSTYFFSIYAESETGQKAELTGERFMTRSIPKITLVSNVNNLSVAEQNGDAELTWENPDDPEFSSVRVVRSTNFFPRDILDGKILYEGSGEEFLDSDIDPKTRYFYSVFAKSKDGRYSSGAVARFSIDPGAFPAIPLPGEPVPGQKDLRLDLPDFYVTQSPIEGSHFFVTKGVPVLISVPALRVPPSVKTILLTFPHWKKKNSELSYLLRLNEAKNAYEAMLPGFQNVGEFNFSFEVFGTKNELLKMIPGTFFVAENYAQNSEFGIQNFSSMLGLVLFIFFALFLAIFLRKLYTVFLG